MPKCYVCVSVCVCVEVSKCVEENGEIPTKLFSFPTFFVVIVGVVRCSFVVVRFSSSSSPSPFCTFSFFFDSTRTRFSTIATAIWIHLRLCAYLFAYFVFLYKLATEKVPKLFSLFIIIIISSSSSSVLLAYIFLLACRYRHFSLQSRNIFVVVVAFFSYASPST